MLFGCSVNISNDQPNSTEGSITKYRNTKSGIESIITKDALESFEKYANASKHKAFAQSLSGVWGWKSNRTSAEHARTSALVACQRNNKKSEELYPCEIINVDGVWVE
jgi:hypothetical protein